MECNVATREGNKGRSSNKVGGRCWVEPFQGEIIRKGSFLVFAGPLFGLVPGACITVFCVG
jgi:hypothetical protein